MTRAPIGDVIEALQPGTEVEVRNGFDGSWSRGFEVAEVSGDGYSVRRLSDGMILPIRFGDDDVRRERRKSMWWI